MNPLERLRPVFPLLTTEEFVEISIGDLSLTYEKEIPSLEEAETAFIKDLTKSTLLKFFDEICNKKLFDENGKEDLLKEIGVACNIFRDIYSVPDSAFLLYRTLTKRMSVEERREKIMDPAFMDKFRENLLGLIDPSYRKPRAMDFNFDARAPFPLFCRDLCDWMIERIGKASKSWKEPRSSMATLLMGALRTALGCIHALTVGDEKGGVAGWRSLYEQECTLIVLHNSKRATLERFKKWPQYIEKGGSGKALKIFLKNEMEKQNIGGKMIEFCHYGWFLEPGECEKKRIIDRDKIEKAAGQSRRKEAYRYASEVAHGVHPLTKEKIEEMRMFICRELPLSLKNLVKVTTEEIEKAEKECFDPQNKNGERIDLNELKEQTNIGLARIEAFLPFSQGSYS